MNPRQAIVRVIAVLLPMVLAACGEGDGKGAAGPPPVTVSAPLVKEITEWDEYTGRFEAMQAVEVRARVSGYLTQIAFKDGQVVQKGDLLFVIDPRPYEAALAQARASLARGQTQQQLANNDLERATRLLQTKAISVEEHDARLQRKKEADAVVDGSKAAVTNAELDLEFTHIKAQFSGRVGAKRIDVGNLVSGGSGGATVLTTIVSLNPIRFVFDASEAAYLKYTRRSAAGERTSSREAANPVDVRLADETAWTRRGHMDFVDNQVNVSTGTIRGRAIFQNDDMFLTPGVFGRLRLLAADQRKSVLIPDSAILSDQARKVVALVDKDGVVSFRPVTLGPVVDGLRVIREGLVGTEHVVTNGVLRARPGSKVTPTLKPIDVPPPSAGGASP